MWVLFALVAGGLLIVLVANLSSSEKKIEHEIEHLYAVGDPQFVRSMGTLLGPAIVGGNRVTALLNGDEIFPAMLEAIRCGQADHHLRDLHLLVRRHRQGSSPTRSAERARAGVKVHVLIDWVGRREDGRVAARRDGAGRRRGRASTTRSAGTTWRGSTTAPTASCWSSTARVGFTGGVGIADKWRGNAEDPRALARLPFPDRGPGGRPDAGRVHGQLDQGHAAACCTATRYFPRAAAGGHARRAGVQELAGRGRRERAAHVPAVDRRRREERRRIANAYFVPDELAVATLGGGAARAACGCEIIVPGAHMDAHGRPQGLAIPLGASCSRQGSRSTSTSRRCTTAR